MGLLITIEHHCPASDGDCRPYLDEHNGKWYLPMLDDTTFIEFCPFCGADLISELKDSNLTVTSDVLGICIG